MLTDPRLALAQIEVIRGAYAAAVPLVEAALPTAEAQGHRHNLKFGWELLARIAVHRGRVAEAQAYAERAHALAQETGDRWTLAYALNTLGNLAYTRQDDGRARDHFAASLAIQEELGDRGAAGAALNKLGLVALRQGDPAAAGRHFERSRAVFEETGDPGGLIDALEGLGNAAAAQGDLATARERFREALRAASGRAFGIYLPSLLASVGELALRAGAPARGGPLLALARRHPATTHNVRERARRLLPEPLAGGPDAPGPPPEDNQALVALLLGVLDDLESRGAPGPPPPGGGPGAGRAALGARAGRPAPAGGRPDQPGDRRAPDRHRGHRQDPRAQPVRQARRAHPRARRRPRPRAGPPGARRRARPLDPRLNPPPAASTRPPGRINPPIHLPVDLRRPVDA